MPGGRRRFKWATLACWAALAAGAAAARGPIEPPLHPVRTWVLAEDELAGIEGVTATHRLRLEMAMLSGSGWNPDAILAATRESARILAQCGIRVHRAELHELDGPARYRLLFTPVSRDLARRARLARPAVFFVADTRNRPAFDAEAVGRANSRLRPEMADTVWIVAGARDLPVVLAHELVHVLADSGEHSDAPGNLMREETAAGAVALAPEQCRHLLDVGTANGLLVPLPR